MGFVRGFVTPIVHLFSLVFLFTFCAAQTPAPSGKKIENDPTDQRAEELYKQGKFVDALPLFEALSADYPSDVAVRERWAWCLFQYAGTLPEPEKRKSARARARKIAIEANKLGDNSQILQLLLELPEDGGEDVKFSDRREIDDAMKKAEGDFSRGDLEKAREGYLRVLLMDPNNYDAALFTGDVYFKEHVQGAAGEWYARAIQIDPNRETAYRYWGDSLAALGKEEEARSKYIEAIVADPYRRRSWTGLENWVNRNKLTLNYVKLKDGSAVSVKENKNVTLTIDNSLKEDDPDITAWVAYGIGRSSWQTEATKKEFPNIPRDRHTMQEEVFALNLMITIIKEDKDYKKTLPKRSPAIQALLKIQEAGFLEPFVLLNRADDGITQDYVAYRDKNRELIRRYLDEYVVPKIPAAGH